MYKTLLFLGAVLVTAGLGQDREAPLRQYFEGKQVVVKMDMPATKDGVDVQFGSPQPIDFREYSNRIKNKGVSLRNGDRVMITTVKVKDNLIEFQLGGGGWGTLSDNGAPMMSPQIKGKTDREKDLERRIDQERDSRTKRDMQRDLDRMRDSRERRNSDERARAEEINSSRREENERKALGAGSRFNIRFQKGYFKEQSPTPEMVMQALGQYVDFEPMSGSAR